LLTWFEADMSGDTMNDLIHPFLLTVAQSELDDLAERLKRTR